MPTRGSASRGSLRTANGRRSRTVLDAVIRDLDRLRLDGGVSMRRLADAAGVDAGYLSQVANGTRLPSIPVLVALASALGADLSIRAYPNTGPVIHDRIQARIVEELLRIAAPIWNRAVEVPVSRPARGYVDVVLDDAPSATTVAAEVESRIDRLEQQIRWAHAKALSLPSSELLARSSGERAIHRLLVVRSTSATRDVARRFDAVIRAAYPARTVDILRSLTGGPPWPGDGILWAEVGRDVARILERPPRGVSVGR